MLYAGPPATLALGAAWLLVACGGLLLLLVKGHLGVEL